MADIDLKTATPDTSLPTTGFLFGADSQAASSPSVYSTQTVATTFLGSTTLTGTTITTDDPVLNLSQAWNASGVTFTGLKFNVSSDTSASGSILLDLQVGAATKFRVDKSGNVGLFASSALRLGSSTVNWQLTLATTGIIQGSANYYGFYDGTNLAAGGSVDTRVYRDAANTLALRNGTAAQEMRVYETTTGTIYKAILGNRQLIKIAGAAFDNGAGASAGTLTNAPAVGNPTKWIPIDDNGTTRHIPAW